MKKTYLKPSVEVTELVMVNTLCASGTGGGDKTLSSFNVNATTDEQL